MSSTLTKSMKSDRNSAETFEEKLQTIEKKLTVCTKSDLEKKISNNAKSKYVICCVEELSEIHSAIYTVHEDCSLYMKFNNEKMLYDCWSTEDSFCNYQLQPLKIKQDGEDVLGLLFKPIYGNCGDVRDMVFEGLGDAIGLDEGKENKDDFKTFKAVNPKEWSKFLSLKDESSVLNALTSMSEKTLEGIQNKTDLCNAAVVAMANFEDSFPIVKKGAELLKQETKDNRKTGSQDNNYVDLKTEKVVSLAVHWEEKLAKEKKDDVHVPMDILATLTDCIAQTRCYSGKPKTKSELIENALEMNKLNSRPSSSWNRKETIFYTQAYFGKKFESLFKDSGSIKKVDDLYDAKIQDQFKEKFDTYKKMLEDQNDVVADPTTRGLAKVPFGVDDYDGATRGTKDTTIFNASTDEKKDTLEFGELREIKEEMLNFYVKFEKDVKIQDVWKSCIRSLSDAEIDFMEDPKNNNIALYVFETSVLCALYLRFFLLKSTGELALEMQRLNGDSVVQLNTLRLVESGLKKDKIAPVDEKGEIDDVKDMLSKRNVNLLVTGQAEDDNDDDDSDEGGEGSENFLMFKYDPDLVDMLVTDLTQSNLKNKVEAACVLSWNINDSENHKLIVEKNGEKLAKACANIITKQTTNYVLMVKCLEILFTMMQNKSTIDKKAVQSALDHYTAESKNIQEIDSRMMGSTRVHTLFKAILSE